MLIDTIVAEAVTHCCDPCHKSGELQHPVAHQIVAPTAGDDERRATLEAMVGILVQFALILLLATTAIPASGQNQSSVTLEQQTKRLVLKDGSYQMVRSYEIQGEKVHYWSAERNEWEDLPANLVDWDATKKYEANLAQGQSREHVETPEEREDREREEANSPEILPGLRLPGTGGVFLLDQYSGKPELAEILQNGSELNQAAAKKGTLRTVINPVGSSKHAFELKGLHATVQSHTATPTLYLDIDEPANSDTPLNQRFRIVRADIKNGTRIIGNLKVTFTGKTSQESNFVPSSAEKIGTGSWVKVMPFQPLPPGEYAVVEMLGQDEMNLYVWDFGVDPHAPANTSVWRNTSDETSNAPK